MTMPQRLGATLVVVLALLGLTAGTSAAQQVPTVGVSIPPAGPPQTDILSAGLWSALHAEASPPGANDYTCTPGPGHPNPVVLVHGTFGNAYAGPSSPRSSRPTGTASSPSTMGVRRDSRFRAMATSRRAPRNSRPLWIWSWQQPTRPVRTWWDTRRVG